MYLPNYTMKIKMPCKLCDIENQKFGVTGCTHSNYMLPQMPAMVPLSVGLQVQNSTFLVPQIRDLMLAAYLYRGYYQPAGPLISVAHGHSQTSIGKTVPLSEPSPTVSPPMQQPPPPSSAGDSSDSEVIITSVTPAKEAAASAAAQQTAPPVQHHQQYRLNHYPAAHTSYPYSYPPQYYTAPPAAYSHHDVCFPPYAQHKYMYRRYISHPPLGPQYYPTSSQDIYNQPQPTSSQQVATATSSASGSSYPSSPSGPPPPPTLIETYPPPPPTLVEAYPPPPAHYYPGYHPPPTCYTHSPPTRTLNYINAAYQSCPCPMQSCPKNVHTGPLAGESKRSNSIAKESVPLPPVALALPLEPASATGPPSPARGSAGMPPPPSPAGATYQPPPPKPEASDSPDLKPAEKKRKARVGKAMVRNTIAANHTMLLMCHSPSQSNYLGNVKREVESPKETQSDTKICEPDAVELCDKIVSVEPDEPLVVSDEPQSLKVEDQNDEQPPTVTDLPCQKTVAENVKVKNMKRKLSLTKETPAAVESSPPQPKNAKLEKINGSYKDLIKKNNVSVIKINNGRRKLITVAKRAMSKMKLKSKPVKRKLSPSKEEFVKRLKSSKPLTASNLHNLKQNLKDTKDQNFVTEDLIQNVEPKRCSKKVVNLKNQAPALLDSLIAKNSVDRTIDSVISEVCGRTNAKVTDTSSALKIDNNNKLQMDTSSVEKKSTVSKRACKAAVKSSFSLQTKGRRKSKSKQAPPLAVSRISRRSLHLRWSNGWMWEGDPFDGKVFINSDETIVIRKCYPAMRHQEGDKIEPRDCVLLKAGQRKNELPFVAKIAALWENPDDGEMMMSLLWYYRPEHTEQGRLSFDQPDEVFASRHKDSNSVACIEDKCYVLTFNEYCRYRKTLRRIESGLNDINPCVPEIEAYSRSNRQPPVQMQISSEMVFFCRRVYDFRQKRIVKNPS